MCVGWSRYVLDAPARRPPPTLRRAHLLGGADAIRGAGRHRPETKVACAGTYATPAWGDGTAGGPSGDAPELFGTRRQSAGTGPPVGVGGHTASIAVPRGRCCQGVCWPLPHLLPPRRLTARVGNGRGPQQELAKKTARSRQPKRPVGTVAHDTRTLHHGRRWWAGNAPPRVADTLGRGRGRTSPRPRCPLHLVPPPSTYSRAPDRSDAPPRPLPPHQTPQSPQRGSKREQKKSRDPPHAYLRHGRHWLYHLWKRRHTEPAAQQEGPE